MFENPRRGRQANNFTTNVPKILNLKSSSEQIFFRKLSLGAPDNFPSECVIVNLGYWAWQDLFSHTNLSLLIANEQPREDMIKAMRERSKED